MLNILVCHLESRKRQMNDLMNCLVPQVTKYPASVLVQADDGKMPIGEKRNWLLSRSTRKYSAFVDDDDMVDENYVKEILEAIERGKQSHGGFVDCIGICGYMIENGIRTWQFRHSITVGRWCRDKRMKIYFRTPNHLNPILTEIAKTCKFPVNNWGEDKVYSDFIRPHLKNEVFIEKPLYFYKIGNK